MAKKIGEILLKAHLITNDQLYQALQEQKKTGERVGSLLVKKGFVEEDVILSCLSKQFGVPTIDLKLFQIETSVLEIIPVKTAQKYTVIPISRVGGTLTLAMADPSDIYAIEDIKFMTNYNIEPVVASEHAILTAIEEQYAGDDIYDGTITPTFYEENLDSIVQEFIEQPVEPQAYHDISQLERIGGMLVRGNVITPEQLYIALQIQKRTGDRVGSLLVKMGVVHEDEVLSCLSKQFGVQAIDLETFQIEASVLETIPGEIAKKYTVIPIMHVGRTLTLAMADPSDLFAIQEIQFVTNSNIEPVVASEHAILSAIQRHYGIPKIGKILLKAKLITSEQLHEALDEWRESGELFDAVCLRKGYVEKKRLLAVLSEYFGIPAIDLETCQIESSLLRTVPVETARKYSVIPVCLEGKTLILAMADPSSSLAKASIMSLTSYAIKPVVAPKHSIIEAIERHYKPKLGEILLEAHVISPDQLQQALQKQRNTGKRLGSLLVKMGFVKEDEILNYLSDQYHVPSINLQTATLEASALKIIPSRIARKNTVIPVGCVGQRLTLAMVDPTNTILIRKITTLTNYTIEPVVATEQSILEAVDRYYELEDLELIELLEQEIGQKLRSLRSTPRGAVGYQINKQRHVIALSLPGIQLQNFPQTIVRLTNLKDLTLRNTQLDTLPAEIKQLTNLTSLDLMNNNLSILPSEIGSLTHLKALNVENNRLTSLPPQIGQLGELTILELGNNQLNTLPIEIGHLTNLRSLGIKNNELRSLPSEIGSLRHLTTLNMGNNQLTTLPPQIGQLAELTTLNLENNQLEILPPQIGKLSNLTDINISNNQLNVLPTEIKLLVHLIRLNLAHNQLNVFPSEISQLTDLAVLDLRDNQITNLLEEAMRKLISLNELSSYHKQVKTLIDRLNSLTELNLDDNPLKQPPPEIVKQGTKAIGEYLLQLLEEAVEHSEAKLLLVGQGDVGKTCLAKRLLFDTFQPQKSTEGIDILEWDITAPTVKKENIKLNVWDFGGQEIYHATHQFFLTKRSVYLLVWNARKSKDYEHIYYWLHTIEAFGEDSPVILVLSKVNERDDDLNLKDLKKRFPQIVDLYKVDSKDGRGIPELEKIIRRTAWNLPHMRTPWVKSWFNVRERLEQSEPDSLFKKLLRRPSGKRKERKYERDWITFKEFQRICKSEGLNKQQTDILDEYLHDLGVIIHFRDRLELRNMVILKPEWATSAVYKVIDTQTVRERGGILFHDELEHIWNTDLYPSEIHPQLLELMNTFELAYRLPDGKSHLVAELLPSTEPEFGWNYKQNLCFYYHYDFLPAGVITRFIVRVHEDLEEIKRDDRKLPLCWREGAILRRDETRAFVRVKPVERLIEIRIIGRKKRELLAIIRREFDHIHKSIRKIKIIAEIPCPCSEGCSHRFNYEQLLKAEERGKQTVDCPETWNEVSISSLLNGYEYKHSMEISEKIGKENIHKKKLPFVLHQKITEFFASVPNIHDSNTQRALIYSAALDTQLQHLISFTGSPAQFFPLLVSTLRNYGMLEDGREALEAVLEAAKNYVGKDRRDYCNTLIQELRGVSNGEECPLPKYSPNGYIQLLLESDSEDFNETKCYNLINVLAALLNTDTQSIRIIHVSPKSNRIIIKLPIDDVIELNALFDAKSERITPLLNRFSVKSVRMLKNEEISQLLFDLPIEKLNNMRGFLNQKLSKLEKALTLETDTERKSNLEHKIAKIKTSLRKIEQQIREIGAK